MKNKWLAIGGPVRRLQATTAMEFYFRDTDWQPRATPDHEGGLEFEDDSDDWRSEYHVLSVVSRYLDSGLSPPMTRRVGEALEPGPDDHCTVTSNFLRLWMIFKGSVAVHPPFHLLDFAPYERLGFAIWSKTRLAIWGSIGGDLSEWDDDFIHAWFSVLLEQDAEKFQSDVQVWNRQNATQAWHPLYP
ncbi:hypothetical protein K461DRAFT_64424 [Myriangium duriaei CBS 260.36]|uniref:Uncharacterized protein n=1 Tax=Myriangium duriaei CBS 260.36 TaxID=1168546 RepID=A0A9P4MC85_9PEZI|nr:hypothetical protein K461DRAFT_64424 [Myriangium duriaei CBS 260.36]